MVARSLPGLLGTTAQALFYSTMTPVQKRKKTANIKLLGQLVQALEKPYALLL